ncbi:MAG: hypothetical protein H6Q20_992 [Bacteroidetes bacterium]|nr:hypothetical protein [Bacteroidota bacterium]
MKTIRLFFAVITLTTLCSLTTLQAQTNLVPNPGFETVMDGVPDNWTNLSPSTLTIQAATDVVYAGSKSLKVISTYGFDFVINYVPVTPGKTYNLSVWYNIQSYTGSRSGVSLAYTYIDADGNNLNNGGQIAGGAITSGSVVGSTTVIKANTVTLQTWGQLTLTTNEVVPSTAAYIGILLRPNQITAYFDNASVTEVGAVSKQDQTISGLSNLEKTVGDADFSLSATATSGLAVTYSSSNTAVATISGNTVHIVGAGTTTITASQAGNDTYNAATPVTATLTVEELKVSAIRLGLSLEQGSTAKLTATVSPTNATNTNVTWSSDNTAVVTVDNTGNIAALTVGSAIITVASADGAQSVEFEINVTISTANNAPAAESDFALHLQPNPVVNEARFIFTSAGSGASIVISDLSGKTVVAKIIATNSTAETVDVSVLAKGTYIARYTDAAGKQAFVKMIK